jgi:hypothetical protein
LLLRAGCCPVALLCSCRCTIALLRSGRCAITLLCSAGCALLRARRCAAAGLALGPAAGLVA